MNLWELFVIAVGLSMDAFAVSICKGLSVSKLEKKHNLITGAWFGGFQALMPLIGYLCGIQFATFIENFDHWIAFILLAIIGINMIREANETEEGTPDFSMKAMFPMAIATSIDALAVGVTFAFLKVDIGPAVLFIGCTTFVLSSIGVSVGNVFGSRYKTISEIIGGTVLIVMGLRILLTHLGIF